MQPIIRWASQAEINSSYTSDYWNDVTVERDKAWWIEGPDDTRLQEFLTTNGLMDQFRNCVPEILSLASLTAPRHIDVLDLAAGTGWSSALLSQLDVVDSVAAVEFSEHRLGELFERTVASLGGFERKIQRYHGSFYDIKLVDESVDIVFMSQAFHHADRPHDLLRETDRVLRPGGLVIMIGEHCITVGDQVRRLTSSIVRRRQIPLTWSTLFPPDPILGDHYYRRREYRKMLETFGHSVELKVLGGDLSIFSRKPS